MKLILVRHTETVANSEKKYIGHEESALTDRGIWQLKKLSLKLRGYKFDKIYSSPMSRTIQVANSLNIKSVVVDDRLKEINFGIFENKTYKEVEKMYQKEFQQWSEDYINYQIPKGESLIQVQKRVEDFVESLSEGTNLIITHGGIIQCMIIHLLNLKVDDRWKFKIPLGSIVEIEYEDGYGILTRMSS